jgi:hypothetical protein
MNWPRIPPDTNGELSDGKLGSRIGVDISNLWFVFRRPSSTPARRHEPRNGPCTPHVESHSGDSLDRSGRFLTVDAVLYVQSFRSSV